jgi:hypothetical protein
MKLLRVSKYIPGKNGAMGTYERIPNDAPPEVLAGATNLDAWCSTAQEIEETRNSLRELTGMEATVVEPRYRGGDTHVFVSRASNLGHDPEALRVVFKGAFPK